MRKYFTAGLIILLPIVLTLLIVRFLVNFLTHPFLEPVQAFLVQQHIFQHSWLFSTTALTLTSKLLILLSLVGCIFIIGLLTNIFLLKYFFRFGNFLLHNLPFINKIYKACQDVVHSVFSSSSTSFSQVVLAPFPDANSLTVGLVAQDALSLEALTNQSDGWVAVFIPGTPNPSVGFMLMFKKEDLLFIDMKVDEAMKFVMSCGVVMPDFKIAQLPSVYAEESTFQSHLLQSSGQLNQNSVHLH